MKTDSAAVLLGGQQTTLVQELVAAWLRRLL